MGKAGRSKRERKAKDLLPLGKRRRLMAKINPESLRGVRGEVRFDHEYLHRSLYRWVELGTYANDLLQGRVWITTLEACRRAEAPGSWLKQ